MGAGIGPPPESQSNARARANRRGRPRPYCGGGGNFPDASSGSTVTEILSSIGHGCFQLLADRPCGPMKLEYPLQMTIVTNNKVALDRLYEFSRDGQTVRNRRRIKPLIPSVGLPVLASPPQPPPFAW